MAAQSGPHALPFPVLAQNTAVLNKPAPGTGAFEKPPSEKVKVLPRYVESRPADVQNLVQ
jgi:hypothetical protein